MQPAAPWLTGLREKARLSTVNTDSSTQGLESLKVDSKLSSSSPLFFFLSLYIYLCVKERDRDRGTTPLSPSFISSFPLIVFALPSCYEFLQDPKIGLGWKQLL